MNQEITIIAGMERIQSMRVKMPEIKTWRKDVYVWKIRVVASQSQETIELVGHVTLLK